MTPERLDELIALATLGELSPADEHELDVAVRSDPAVRAEVDEALTTASSIQAIHVETPSPALRATVLATIAQTPQDDGLSDDARHGTNVVEAAESDSRSGGAPVVSMQAARSRRRKMLPIVLGAAAAIVFVIGAFIVSNEASAPDQYAAVFDAADAETHTVAGEIGTLTVTYSASLDAMVVVGDGITPVSADETYQVWVDIDGQMTSAGLFRPDDDGSVEERIEVADGTGNSINVTGEPAGGSESPTLPVLATSG